MSVRVVLADDHRMVRDALVMLLSGEAGIEVAGVADDGPGAVAMVHAVKPDVLVLDIAMPGANGIEVTRQLKDEQVLVKIVVLSAYMDKRFIQEALRAGASGYVAKAGASSELARAIRAVANGQKYLCPEVTATVVGDFAPDAAEASPLASLSAREREILRMVVDGVRSSAIARRLGITEATVEVHRRNFMRKLKIRTVAELTKFAVREGLTTL